MINDIKKSLSLYPDKVKDNIEIVDASELDYKFLLHITKQKPRNNIYFPQISKRQAIKEDNTIPRVTVSDSILGCFIGYQAATEESLNHPEDVKNFKQGYYINKIPFEYALLPNNKLVYDQSRSNEHWLITYSKETKEYKSETIGKFFISEISFRTKDKSYPDVLITIYIEVTDPIGIPFSKNIYLPKGYFMIKGPGEATEIKHNKDKDFIVTEITKEMFKEQKEYSASMLSMDHSKPAFIRW